MLDGHIGLIRTVVFSPDGQYVASGSEDSSANVWMLSTGDSLCSFSGHTQGVIAAVFSPCS